MYFLWGGSGIVILGIGVNVKNINVLGNWVHNRGLQTERGLISVAIHVVPTD
jgi:hypothetical protein